MSLVYESPPVFPPDVSAVSEAPLSAAVEYSFLADQYVDQCTLAEACRLAEFWGAHPHDVLIATGRIDEETYVRALAAAADVPFCPRVDTRLVSTPIKATLRDYLSTGVLEENGATRRLLLGFTCLRPFAMRALIARLAPRPVALVAPGELRRVLFERFGNRLVRGATETLRSRRPHLSAYQPATSWQKRTFVLACAALLASGLIAPLPTLYAITIALACVFLPVIVFRMLATAALVRNRPRRSLVAANPTPDAALPTYTILAPLYREAHMLRPLMDALSRLDWPALGSKRTKAA